MVPSLSCLVVVCTPFSPFTIPASFCMWSQTSALFSAPASLMPDHRYRPGAHFLSSLRTGSLSSSGMHLTPFEKVHYCAPSPVSTSTWMACRRLATVAVTMSTMMLAADFILSMPLSGNSQARQRTRGDRKGNRKATGIQIVEGANAACTRSRLSHVPCSDEADPSWTWS